MGHICYNISTVKKMLVGLKPFLLFFSLFYLFLHNINIGFHGMIFTLVRQIFKIKGRKSIKYRS